MEHQNTDSYEPNDNLYEQGRLTQEEATRLYLKNLYDLNPNKVLLARMWEDEPKIMSELMPEVGTDAFKVPEVPNWKVTAGIAMNTLRLCFDKWPKETRSPEKRMRDAWQDLQYAENDETED